LGDGERGVTLGALHRTAGWLDARSHPGMKARNAPCSDVSLISPQTTEVSRHPRREIEARKQRRIRRPQLELD